MQYAFVFKCLQLFTLFTLDATKLVTLGLHRISDIYNMYMFVDNTDTGFSLAKMYVDILTKIN